MIGFMRSLIVGMSLVFGATTAFALKMPPLPTTSSAQLRAYVDQTTISAGGSLTLTVEYAGQTSEEPDFSPLHKDFTILSRQTSQESSFINGNHQAKTRWVVELLPKTSTKDLAIPSIKMGGQSTAAIAILQSAQAASSNKSGIVVSMSTDRSDVYVNGEIILTVSIKTALSIRNPSLSKPEISDAIVETLNEGERGEVVENGINYVTFKQTYAVYPSKPGSLTIPAVIFRGIAPADRARGQGLGGFFAQGSSVNARSNELSVQVKEVPAAFPKDHQFLPLKSFIVIDAFDEANPQFEVNKAFSRRFEMRAKGTLGSFLPTIATPSVKDLQVYTEAGTKLQRNEPDGMIASTKFSHVYMPLVPGHLVVPEQTIYWWDVDEDKLKTAVIRSLAFDVKGDGTTPAPSPTPTVPEQQLQDSATPSPSTSEPALSVSPSANYLWQIIAGVCLLLWLATLAVFFFLRRRARTKAEHKHEKPLAQQLKERVQETLVACGSNDPKVAYSALKALLTWSGRHDVDRHEQQILTEHMRELEASLYDRNAHAAPEIMIKIKGALPRLRVSTPANVDILPLYPQ